MKTAFLAYPAKDPEIVETMQAVISGFNDNSRTSQIEGWEQNDIVGVPLADPIFHKIENAEYLAADITNLNENVVFEIGYAIGQGKRCLLFKNNNIVGDHDLVSRVGIFDTLGYLEYSTAEDIINYIDKRTEFGPIPFEQKIDHTAPLYMVEPSKRPQSYGVLESRIKKARWRFRSFNPHEDVRLAAMDAIRHVSQSAGVILHLLPDNIEKQFEHNLRSMFVAGLAIGMDIPTLITHRIEHVPPMDVRDLTKKFKYPDDILDIIQDFSLEITSFSQTSETASSGKESTLTAIGVGDPTAENEMTTLYQYFLATDEYQRALRGEVNLVVGRKGSGKTALFVQLRDRKRSDKRNIVVDLKPQGYQLVKLKERVLDFLSDGARQHLITAFWEYLLLLEITYKVLEKDTFVHLRDHNLTDAYNELKDLYEASGVGDEGDFSERMFTISNSIAQDYGAKFGDDRETHITTSEITELLYKHDMKNLIKSLLNYLSFKGEVWLLFDNIDKGWHVEGVSKTDIFVLNCLLSATRKIERLMVKADTTFHSIVFVRDDVYTLLMEGSADYGKEMRATLDWSDRGLLLEVLRKRLVYSMGDKVAEDVSFTKLWQNIAISHYKGEASIEYVLNLSLMRPRNLLKIFRHCLGSAINLDHDKIQISDFSQGLRHYSQDLLTEVDREITDVFQVAEKLIYEFTDENFSFTPSELEMMMTNFGLTNDQAHKALTFLLYYGVFGIYKPNQHPLYIYDVEYNIELLNARIRKWDDNLRYIINPALWPALNIKPDDQLPLV